MRVLALFLRFRVRIWEGGMDVGSRGEGREKGDLV